MKNIKQIRENYDLLTEKEENEERKLTALVRAGLYDAKKLPALKKALDKTADKVTPQEKRMLINLLDTLLSQVLSNQQVYMKVKQNVQHDIKEAAKPEYLSKADPRFDKKFPSDKDIPTVLILKRKAIRVYPDNQKVALYYSQALDKYVTIPFSDIQFAVNEETSEDKKKKSKDISLRASSAANMLRQGKVTSTQTYQKKDHEGNLTTGTIDYSKLNRNKKGSLGDYASKIGGPHPVIGAIGAKIHDTIKGVMRKKRLNKALALRQAKRQAKAAAPISEKSNEPIRAIGSVLNVSPSQSTVSESNMSHITENFKHKLYEKRQERLDEVAPIIAGALALGRMALPAIARGAARAAPRVMGALRSGASKAKDVVKKIRGKTKGTSTAASTGAKKPGWGRKALSAVGKRARGAGAGLAALAATRNDSDNSGGGGSNKPSYKLDRNAGDYQFNLKPTVSSSYADRRGGPDATASRDVQLQRKASQAMLRENVIDTIKEMVQNNISERVINYNEKEITINNTVAKKIMSVYESMNRKNRKMMEEMLNESATSFNRVLTFAIRH